MKIKLSDLVTERQWRSATGFSKKMFYKLLPHFKKCYFDNYGKDLEDRQVKSNILYCIENEDELLFFTLFSLKSGLTYDVLGLVCGMEGSNAKRNQDIGLKTLNKTLERLGYAPRRKFMNIEDFESYFSDAEKLIIDAAEQTIQRPIDKEKQKDYYSGKKNHIQ